MEKLEENIFDQFFRNRDLLIESYRDGEITKKEFVKKNFKFIKKLDLKPFDEITSYERGIYNYQYYNSIAKYYKMMSSEIKNNNGFFKKKDYIEKANLNYYKKDVSVLKLLEFLEFKNVESYYIEVNSKLLKDKLYEIVLKDYQYAVFHSKSKWLLEKIMMENVFADKTKKSVIDYYINERYWSR